MSAPRHRPTRRATTAVVALALVAVTGCTTAAPDADRDREVTEGSIDPATTQTSGADTSSGTTSPAGPPDAGATTTAPTVAEPTGAMCWAAPVTPGDPGSTALVWTDRTADVGLIEPLTGMHAHAAVWGDLDADGWLDLLVGTFADRRPDVYAVRGADGPSPDRLLMGSTDGFVTSPAFETAFGRTSGGAAVDLDLDGDLDLIVTRNVSGNGQASTAIYANDDGTFTPVDAIDPSVAGRAVAVLHIDDDTNDGRGLPDLIVIEDRHRGGSSRLYRNLGNLRFADAGDEWGWPSGVHGLSAATGDLNLDGYTDLIVAGSNRIFFGTGTGLREVDATDISWPPFGAEDDVAGAALADVDGDGRLDLLLGHHFNSTLGRGGPEPVRLFLNQTQDGADRPTWRQVTDEAGLTPLPTKAPHVELADVNNDGLIDVVTSASAGDGTRPAVFVGTGIVDGVPRFATPAGLGSVQYWVSAVTADQDRDGRLDVLAVEWEPTLPTMLFGNETTGGNWLQVSLDASFGAAVGTRVEVFNAATGGRLATREITAAVGYAAGSPLAIHVGLGAVLSVDVRLTPPGGSPIVIEDVAANRHIRLPHGCAPDAP